MQASAESNACARYKHFLVVEIWFSRESLVQKETKTVYLARIERFRSGVGPRLVHSSDVSPICMAVFCQKGARTKKTFFKGADEELLSNAVAASITRPRCAQLGPCCECRLLAALTQTHAQWKVEKLRWE